MRIAIVDDDRLFLEEIEKHVESAFSNIDINSQIKCYDSAIYIMDKELFLEFDVVLLDIDMPGVNGIEFAQMINNNRGLSDTPYIVFVSSMENLVFEALRQFPYSFVRKSHLEELDACLRNIYSIRKHTPTYAIKTSRATKLIDIDKILYIEKLDHYVGYHTTQGVFKERASIKDKYNEFVKHGFVRPHSGIIVNAKYIIEMGGETLRLVDSREIYISRNYKKELKEKYQEWLVKTK